MKIIFIMCLSFIVVDCIAIDLKTTEGVTFFNVNVNSNKTDVSGITITHSRGVVRLKWEDLTKEDQQKYGYEPMLEQIKVALNSKVKIPDFILRLPSDDEISSMSFENMMLHAKENIPFPKVIRTPAELLKNDTEKRRFRKSVEKDLTRVQKDTIAKTFNATWSWPDRDHPIKVQEITGKIKEVRIKSMILDCSNWKDEPQDWLIVELEDEVYKMGFKVCYPPSERQRLQELAKGSTFNVGPGYAIASDRYVPINHWNEFNKGRITKPTIKIESKP